MNDVLLELIPEVADILDFQVTNQLILIKPLVVEVTKTKSGILIPDIGPDGDGGTVDMKKTRQMLPQKGVVVCCGSRVDEIKAGMTVYYYNSSLTEICIRSGEDLYYGIQEYNIKGYLKP